MTESQTIEYKSSWRDEYIKWISGFANAQGGTLFLGKDDRGKTVGLDDPQKLMEDIPNKVRDILGIIVDLDLHDEKGHQFIEVRVEQYPYPISYRGQYFIRSGSTKQQLKGAALDAFLLRKQGRHWDGVPVPRVSIKDLKREALLYFRKEAEKSNRLSREIIEEKDLHLLEKLQLLEGQYLKRAAVLLFCPEPELFVPGAFVKIGRFKTNSELLYQDEIHGPLLEQVEKTMDLLLTKYLSAGISYTGIHRREKYPYPEKGLREAILNAIAHKDYGSHSPVQISVHEQSLFIWNDGRLPENWTIEDLLKKHGSRPFNPLVANTFFRAGLVEAWGRGIEKVIDECVAHGCPRPAFDYRESGLMVEFKSRISGAKKGGLTPEMAPEMAPEIRSKITQEILMLIKGDPAITTVLMAEKIGVGKRTILRHIDRLKSLGIIEREGPTKKGYWRIKGEIQ
jgi:ATP-dependent DNA helicase RecG